MTKRLPISLCALVPYPLGVSPSQRFRVEQWLPQLEKREISIDFRPFTDARLMDALYRDGYFGAKAIGITAAVARRFAGLAGLRRYDAILIHRAACLAGPALLEVVIKAMGLPIIFDFDDAIHLLDTSAANRRFGWLKFPGKTAAICRASTQVVVGNSYLAKFASQYNSQITIIPSSVDTEHYRPVVERRAAGRVVVGWMGSSTSQTHLEAFAPVLALLQSSLDFELRIISDRDPILPGVRFVWRPWSVETEIQELAEFDIGIMPMPDDQWSRGKCAMKALLYMAMGIPVICSAVGTNREVIEHGRNGLLAEADEDWHAQLEGLLADPEQRRRLGTAGRQTVENHYSMERCASNFAGVIEKAVASRRPFDSYEVREPHIVGGKGSISRN